MTRPSNKNCLGNFPVSPLLILLFLVIAISCNKEEDSPESNLEMIFEDYFNDNSQNWPVFDDETAMATIEDGKYILEHKIDDSDYWYSVYMYKDLQSNYTIETSISLIEGVEDFLYGVIWFRKDSYNHYYMNLIEDKFLIGYVFNYGYHSVSGWKESESINQDGETNIIKIVKTADHLDFYINGNFVYQFDPDIIVGDEFGFKVQSKGKIAIDYIKIYR